MQQLALTSHRSPTSTINICHGGVVCGRFCSFDLTPFNISALYSVAIPLNHKRYVAFVIMTTVTYALIYRPRAAVGAKFPCVYSADQRYVVTNFCVVTNWWSVGGFSWRWSWSWPFAVCVAISRSFFWKDREKKDTSKFVLSGKPFWRHCS